MNQNDNSTPPGPPAGLLADAALKESPATQVVAATSLPASETPPIIDPTYTEPPAPAALRECAKVMSLEGAPAAFVNTLITRIELLEKAALPFASHAMLLSNAHMCLIADGRPKEPSGGTWTNGTARAQLQTNESIFYDACDAYGRQRVEAEMMAAFDRVQVAQKAYMEKQAHVADKKLEGPIAGPVTGKIH